MDDFWLICYIEKIISKNTLNHRASNAVHCGPMWKWFDEQRRAQESCRKNDEEVGVRTVRDFVLVSATRISRDDYNEFKAREDDGFVDNCVDWWHG